MQLFIFTLSCLSLGLEYSLPAEEQPESLGFPLSFRVSQPGGITV